MRIVFISPEYMDGRGTSHYPPVHLLYLADRLIKGGHQVSIFDCGGHTPECMESHLAEHLREAKPDLVGLTLYTTTMTLVKRLVEIAKQITPHARIVLGGGHPTADCRDTLELFSEVDFAMRGECESTLARLASDLDAGHDTFNIPGLAFRAGQKITLNPGFGLTDNPEDIPVPPRHLLESLPPGAYWHMLSRGPVSMMITTRGCSFNCAFCFKVSRKTRFHSVERVMAEIEDIPRRDIRNIHIMDDAFTLRRDRGVTILEEILRNYPGLRLKIRSRVTSVDAELFALMKRAASSRSYTASSPVHKRFWTT